MSGSAPPPYRGGDITGPRFAAGLVDTILLILLPLAVFFAVSHSTPTGLPLTGGVHYSFTIGHTEHYVTGSSANVVTVVAIGWWLIIGVAMPVVSAGMTPGMLLCGLRTVRLDGGPVSFGRHVIRTLLWVVDDFPYVIPGLVAFIVVLVTPHKQRVGDLAAGTTVVRR